VVPVAKMKILCLHGYGTSASVLESQFGALAAQSDKTWEYIPIDGEVECSKAPSWYQPRPLDKWCSDFKTGVGAFVPGPFFCYYKSFAPSDVKKAHELVSDIIEEEGPFDGVFGFSQGASLALGYLIQHEIHRPREPPPFKFAVIFSTVIAFSPEQSFCQEILDKLTGKERNALSSFPNTDFSVLHTQARALFEPLAVAMQSGVNGGFLEAAPDAAAFERGDTTNLPRIMNPSLLEQRVNIPTVHIVGKKDSPLMLEQSALMKGLCESKLVKSIEHSGGHDLPRKMDEVKATLAAIDWAINQSRQQFW
jgi:predicted esterase